MARVNMAIIGCGGMARHHARNILQQQTTTKVIVVSEPSPAAYAAMSEVFLDAGLEPPPNEPDLTHLLANYGDALDTAFIITPHVYHCQQAQALLDAGVDVLLEKPMVMNGAEAEQLIQTRDASGSLLVVAFNGSLSPQIRTAVSLLRSGELGHINSVSATVWQSWRQATTGTWRQVPEVAGGGFLFDTGAHMLNTVSDLVGEEFSEVAAWTDNRATPVDILGVVIARTRSGVLVTLHACGETAKSCHSDVRVFCSEAILRTGVWGERLELQRSNESDLTGIAVPPSLGVWEQFLAVRAGTIVNPSPPEVGLRMARLWDAIKASAALDGQVVRV